MVAGLHSHDADALGNARNGGNGIQRNPDDGAFFGNRDYFFCARLNGESGDDSSRFGSDFGGFNAGAAPILLLVKF